MELKEVKKLAQSIKDNISKVIVGKEEITDLVLVALFCSGHILLEDVPGVGKTVLAKCLAKSIACEFRRVQFTPDLLPSDLTGINYYNQKENEFVFRKGPIFANIVLADEINRATPRTQASMLECMEERQVSIDGDTRILEGPFFVIATQNPIETHGTFPLPEAQLDRFFMRLKMGYPSKEEGRKILDRFQINDPFPEIEAVISAKEIIEIQKSFFKVRINDVVKDYIMSIIEKTRNDERISLGVSPRGSLAVMRASQVLAVMKDRDFVIPDDVKNIAVSVLSHRIILKGRAIVTGQSVSSEAVIADILNNIPVPVEDI
jgi:MoxR-like ATPase